VLTDKKGGNVTINAKRHDKMFIKVLFAFVLGILYGVFFPDYTGLFEIVSNVFVRSIKLVVVPIIFFSLLAGMCSHAREEKGMPRLFMKTIVYFEVMSLIAILITFGLVLYFAPGSGLDIQSFPKSDTSSYIERVKGTGLKDFVYTIFPDNFFATLTQDHLLAVIFLAIISAIAISRTRKNEAMITFVEEANRFFFQVIHIIIGFSPYATFAAIAYSVGHAGLSSLSNLASLVGVIILSMFVFCVLICLIARIFFGIPILRLLVYIKQELLLAYATSSSESVFPQLLEKLEKFGCSKKVVSFVLPMGYSFNLDGTAIYVTAGAVFIQQAYQVSFSVTQYLTLFFILLFTSKGAAGVMGAGFITLSATLAAIPGQPIPLEGLAILLGIDRFMSDARTICNIVGNAVGTLIIAKSEDAFIPVSEKKLGSGDLTA
jgi:aerobic C4-dicarboxylate transport protein